MKLLDKYLTMLILIAILIGTLLGLAFPNIADYYNKFNLSGSNNLILIICLTLMMYPPFAKVNYKKVIFTFKDTKSLIISLLLNWIIGPILMFVMANFLLHNYPEYRTGVIIIGLARCIAMVSVWNELAHGSRELCIGLVALNSVFQVLFFGLYIWIFLYFLPHILNLQSYNLHITMLQVLHGLLLYLFLPFMLGIITKFILVQLKGIRWYQKEFCSRIGYLTLIFLLVTVILLFSLKAYIILHSPKDLLVISLPLCLYFFIMFFSSFHFARLLGLKYNRASAIAFTATGNNFELAIAIAIAVFGIGSKQALAGIVGPLIEVPVLLCLVQYALAQKKFFKR